MPNPYDDDAPDPYPPPAGPEYDIPPPPPPAGQEYQQPPQQGYPPPPQQAQMQPVGYDQNGQPVFGYPPPRPPMGGMMKLGLAAAVGFGAAMLFMQSNKAARRSRDDD